MTLEERVEALEKRMDRIDMLNWMRRGAGSDQSDKEALDRFFTQYSVPTADTMRKAIEIIARQVVARAVKWRPPGEY